MNLALIILGARDSNPHPYFNLAIEMLLRKKVNTTSRPLSSLHTNTLGVEKGSSFISFHVPPANVLDGSSLDGQRGGHGG